MAREETLAKARTWLEQDPDPATRDELKTLIDSNSDELEERFAGPLAFGTAGLRGIIGAGETRMNRAVVLRTAAGLGRYLLDTYPDAKQRGVVIGYDGRHLSDVFAEDTARVLAALGIRTFTSKTTCPTPMAAFAVTKLACVAGVMVTASHNPPEYNGYKVYADNGAQIVPPADTGIAAAIETIGAANAIPCADLATAQAEGLADSFGAELEAQYLDAICALVPPE